MSVRNFVPSIWSRQLLISLKKNLVANSLVNRNWEGEIRNQGDTVKITTPSAVSTRTYTGADITFDEVASTQQDLKITQSEYFAFQLDDVDKTQANVNLMQPYADEASFALANVADQFILGHYTSADPRNVITETLSEENIYKIITRAKKNLSKRNAPPTGRWIVLDPYEISLLENSSQFTAASDLGDEVKRTGFAGLIAGMEVFESNNLPVVDGVRYCLYGHRWGITFAEQIASVEAGRREKAFKDFLKGLHLYGAKMVRPDIMGYIATPADESGS